MKQTGFNNTNNTMRQSKTNNLNSSGLLNNSQSGGLNNQSFNKSNVSLWKSKYTQPQENKEEIIENEYIDNLKKQVYFMEMELKLMKEREKEIEKSGGFSKFTIYNI